MKKRKIKKTLIHAFLFVLSFCFFFWSFSKWPIPLSFSLPLSQASPTRLNLYLGFKNTKKLTYQRVQETFHELIR